MFGLFALFLMLFGRSLDINAGGDIFCVLFKMLTVRGWLRIALLGVESKSRIYMGHLRHFSFGGWHARVAQY